MPRAVYSSRCLPTHFPRARNIPGVFRIVLVRQIPVSSYHAIRSIHSNSGPINTAELPKFWAEYKNSCLFLYFTRRSCFLIVSNSHCTETYLRIPGECTTLLTWYRNYSCRVSWGEKGCWPSPFCFLEGGELFP